MKKIILLMIIFFVTGCINYTELNNLAIIKSIGIKYDNNYVLYAEIIDEINKDNVPQTEIIQVNGQTIDELFNNIELQVNKEIYLDHIDLLILDENLNKDYLKTIINYFLDHQELRNDFLTIIGDTEKVLKNAKYDEIEKIILNNKDNKIIKITFEEIISKFLDNKDFYLSKIIYDNKIKFDGNYKYNNDKFERLNNEEN